MRRNKVKLNKRSISIDIFICKTLIIVNLRGLQLIFLVILIKMGKSWRNNALAGLGLSLLLVSGKYLVSYNFFKFSLTS